MDILDLVLVLKIQSSVMVKQRMNYLSWNFSIAEKML